VSAINRLYRPLYIITVIAKLRVGGVAAGQTSYSVVMLREGGMEDGHRKKCEPRLWVGANSEAKSNCD